MLKFSAQEKRPVAVAGLPVLGARSWAVPDFLVRRVCSEAASVLLVRQGRFRPQKVVVLKFPAREKRPVAVAGLPVLGARSWAVPDFLVRRVCSEAASVLLVRQGRLRPQKVVVLKFSAREKRPVAVARLPVLGARSESETVFGPLVEEVGSGAVSVLLVR